MMKRILSALLAVLMLSLLLAGCATDIDKSNAYLDDHELSPKEPKLTLSFCLVTDELVPVAALAEMQNEFNKFTEVSFLTHVKFINVKTTEYAAYLEAKLTDVEAVRAAGTEQEETSTDLYPGLMNSQFDIILITSFEMLNNLVEKGRVLDLSDFIASKQYRNIKEDVTESFLQGSRLGGKYYAIPNCRVMGEYTYLLVNKDVAGTYNYSYSELSDWESTATLREWIERDGSYTFTADPYDTAAPVRLVKGQLADRAAFEAAGNFCYVESVPAIDATELFDSMLAISSYTINADRAMKILYALNTNKTLHTILQYGSQGTTFELNNNVLTKKVNPSYVYTVNRDYTGNVFSLYPCSDYGETAAIMDGWKEQNRNATVVTDFYKVSCEAEEGGTVSRAAYYRLDGTTVTVEATADEGATFTAWYLGTDTTPISTDATFTYTVNAADAVLTAKFAQ